MKPAPTGVSRRVLRTGPDRRVAAADVLVVTLHDERVGFSTRVAEVRQIDGTEVALMSDQGPALSGIASVLRSGSAFDEVRGRTRHAEGWWTRWQRRDDDAVVVLDPAPQPST